MRRREDDLTAWQDDPVVQALTGPASPGELAGEEYALAAFRAATPKSSRRRHLGRLGVGGSALVVAVAFSGGAAAAAYTSSLPTSLQRFSNDLGGWAGVPAAKTEHHHHRTVAAGSTSTPSPSESPPTSTAPVVAPTPSATPSTSPSAHHSAPAHHGVHPKATPTAATSSPATSPTPTPTPTPTPNPTATSIPPPVVSGSITITVGVTRIAVNDTVAVIGRLANPSGAPMANQRVWLIERVRGQTTSSEIASGLTRADGSVELTTPPLAQSARLHLVAGQGIRSAAVAVVVVPTVSASLVAEGSTYTVTVTTDGGDPGDAVTLQRRTANGWTAVATAQLDASATANFSIPVPPKRALRYRVVLPRTPAHAAAITSFSAPPL
jgi:hypothetical protein